MNIHEWKKLVCSTKKVMIKKVISSKILRIILDSQKTRSKLKIKISLKKFLFCHGGFLSKKSYKNQSRKMLFIKTCSYVRKKSHKSFQNISQNHKLFILQK